MNEYRWKKRHSIGAKIMASIMGITLIAVIVIASVFYQESASSIENNYTSLLHQRVRLLSETIDSILQDVCKIAINASCDDELQEEIVRYKETGDEAVLESMYSILRNYKNQNGSISSVYLVFPEEGTLVTSLDYPAYQVSVEDTKIKDFLNEVNESNGIAVINDIVNDGNSMLSYIENISSSDGTVNGYIVVNMDENRLHYDYFDSSESEDLNEFMMLQDDRIIASKTNGVMGTVYEAYEDKSAFLSGDDVTGSDAAGIYVYCRGDFSGCGIFAAADRSVILTDLSQMRRHIVEVAFILLLISLIPAAWLTRLVTRPVGELVGVMQKVSDGDMDTRAENISEDEIGLLSSEFNRMLDQIQELVDQLIREEEEKREAELEALQYQITPHFMYNTLNSIKFAALIRGEKDLAGVLGDFIELLQTCISKKGAFLTVSEEVHVLENYVHLQEFRSGEPIRLDYDIPQEAQMCQIPRLILQPLVENAILHGIDIKERQGHITVTARIDNDRLYLEVKDNGRGMSKEQIEELLNSKAKKTKGLTAVGIPNVRDRLKLYYKEEAGLIYESSEEGTSASIYLPVVKED